MKHQNNALESWFVHPPALAGVRETLRRIHEPGARIEIVSRSRDAAPDVGGIAVIPVRGVIGRGFPEWAEEMGWVANQDRIERDIYTALAEPAIHTVVFDFDSPGGQAVGTHEIAVLIEELGNSRRTVAWTGGMMASAAYYMAAGCGEIYAAPTAMVGSIGAMVALVDSSTAWAEAGFRLEAFSSAPGKLRGMDGRPMEEGDRAFFQAMVEEFGGQFAGFVRRRRPACTRAALTGGDYGQGQSYGVNNGLVDDTRLNFAALIAGLL